MRIGILTDQIPFIEGGAELHARSLCTALRDGGHQAEIISMPFKWFPPDRIAPQILAARLLDVTESSGMTIDRVIGLKFPAYLMPHPNKVLWILHQHRTAYDLWGTDLSDLHDQPGGEAARRAIRAADDLTIPQAVRVFANSRRVAERLQHYNGIASTPLYHPPPDAERFHGGADDGFLLVPSRINLTKRQSLVIEALFHVRSDVRVVIVGRPETKDVFTRLQARAAALPPGRVTFAGGVSEAEKLRLYATCRGVVFVPYDEDYGYVTLEAMLSAKPVITCTDSGGVLEFVADGETGLVAKPEPVALAEAMDRLWSDPALARRLGAQGLEHYHTLDIGWPQVVEALTA